MSKPKRQHYVPQFYLRNFKDESSDNLINCFNIIVFFEMFIPLMCKLMNDNTQC